jgi:hypothetical protein
LDLAFIETVLRKSAIVIMFNFLKKRIGSLIFGQPPVTLDIHSHILPGLMTDPCIETHYNWSAVYEIGIRKSVATPYHRWPVQEYSCNYKYCPWKIKSRL